MKMTYVKMRWESRKTSTSEVAVPSNYPPETIPMAEVVELALQWNDTVFAGFRGSRELVVVARCRNGYPTYAMLDGVLYGLPRYEVTAVVDDEVVPAIHYTRLP